MAGQRALPLLGCLLLLLGLTGGVPFVHDELLWTKQHWQDYKLDFPWRAFKQREPEVVKLLESSELKGFAANSLNGPLGDIQAAIEEDATRPARMQQSGFEVTLLDENTSVAAAAGVAQCKVCQALTRLLWEGVVHWVDVHRAMPSQAAVERYAQQLCDYEVMHDVLGEWVILRARVQQPGSLRIVLEGGTLEQPSEYYMLSSRVKQHASPAEIEVVRHTCRQLLQQEAASRGAAGAPQPPAPPAAAGDAAAAAGGGKSPATEDSAAATAADSTSSGGSAGSSEGSTDRDASAAVGSSSGNTPGSSGGLVPLVYPLLARYHAQLQARLEETATEGGPLEEMPAEEKGPLEARRECIDKHPQCAYWAEKGECESNPNYMLGRAFKQNGWCRRACKACYPPVEPEPHFTEGDTLFMADAAKDLLAQLQEKSCAAAAACKDVARGSGAEQLLERAGAGGEGASLVMQAAYVSGPVLPAGASSGGAAGVDADKLLQSRPMLQRSITDPLVPIKEPIRPIGFVPVGSRTEAASRVLWQKLGGQCLYLSTGWWLYEVCYMQHINQFHTTERNEIDWVISLGKYKAANWGIHNLTHSELYPQGTQVPFVAHFFADGNLCELNDSAAEGSSSSSSSGQGASLSAGGGSDGAGPDPQHEGQHTMRRVTEVQFMCSPDTEAHIVVDEPSKCHYRVELYLPQLCLVEGFAVEGHHPLAPPGGSGSGGGKGKALQQRKAPKDEL